MRDTPRGRRAVAAATLTLAASIGVTACGDDESTTTAATSTETSTTETSTTEGSTTATTESTTSSGDGEFAAASEALEADGFDLEEKTGADLEQSAGLPKPITATAGAVATRPGSSGDLLVFEFATPEEAESYAKANNDSVLTTEVAGTLTLTSTADNTDLLDQALAAIG